MDVGDFTPTETTDTTAEPDTFTYFGEVFAIPATIGAGALLRFTWLIKSAQGQEQRGGQKQRSARTDTEKVNAQVEIIEAGISASSAIYELLRACLGDDQMERFLTTADSNGVAQESLMEVCDRIQSVIAGRPTRRSADSSDGPSTNGESSTDGGSGPTEMSPAAQQRAAIELASTSTVG